MQVTMNLETDKWGDRYLDRFREIISVGQKEFRHWSEEVIVAHDKKK